MNKQALAHMEAKIAKQRDAEAAAAAPGHAVLDDTFSHHAANHTFQCARCGESYREVFWKVTRGARHCAWGLDPNKETLLYLVRLRGKEDLIKVGVTQGTVEKRLRGVEFEVLATRRFDNLSDAMAAERVVLDAARDEGLLVDGREIMGDLAGGTEVMRAVPCNGVRSIFLDESNET